MSEENSKSTQSPQPSDGSRSTIVIDKDLAEFRDLIETPTEFSTGFTWPVIIGAVFCGVIMFPGVIYLWLMAGLGMSEAGKWVTLIVFSEILRRALRSMSKQEMVILLMLSGAMLMGNALISVPGGPFGELIWRQYLVGSDAVQSVGLYGEFPDWFVPAPDSTALADRTFLHIDWLVPIALLLFTVFIQFIKDWTLGYGLFRLLSDVEKLPFPLAPVGAQGALALAEGEAGEKTWRWTMFSIGTMLGLAYGAIYLAVPIVSGAFLDKPLMILPLPWYELSQTTETFLPAVPTGIAFSLGIVILGFIIPFWAALGSFITVASMFVLNPILHKVGVLTTWQPGMGTVDVLISNYIDFYFSVVIGLLVGTAIISVFQTSRFLIRSWRDVARRKREMIGRGEVESLWKAPPGRGDWSIKLCFVGYFFAATALIIVCKLVVPQFGWFFLIFYAFFFIPLLTYLNARIKGIVGMHVEVPLVREAAILLSGAKGITPWLAPIPRWDYSRIPMELRALELTGTRVRSLLKVWMFATPMLFIVSMVFWQFLWQSDPIPGQGFPAAKQLLDYQIKQKVILWSANPVEEGGETLFNKAFNMKYFLGAAGGIIVAYAVLALIGLPTIVLFGLARGYATIPHFLILEFMGCCLARFYLYKKFGKKKFLHYAPVLLAGFTVGMGLSGMAAAAVKLVQSAILQAPF